MPLNFQARMVAAATNNLCEAANSAVQGHASEEKLISSAKQVAASTAQLLVACKVKADQDSQTMKRLQVSTACFKPLNLMDTDTLLSESASLRLRKCDKDFQYKKKRLFFIYLFFLCVTGAQLLSSINFIKACEIKWLACGISHLLQQVILDTLYSLVSVSNNAKIKTK